MGLTGWPEPAAEFTVLITAFSPQRLCLNGSTGQEVIINSGLETVEALAFEPLSQLLYWVDAGFKKIEVQAFLCSSLSKQVEELGSEPDLTQRESSVSRNSGNSPEPKLTAPLKR